jgi:hypothetical protein
MNFAKQELGTYYWYMYLLDLNTLPITGLRKKTDSPTRPASKGDVEAAAADASPASTVLHA